ncbi:uncharacterized protein LOC132284985 [Cornus florida]|uniref:uncharacterized protein LOC132284985 n=1 Tax=Cornus florida TaxID=4283 RepID=UPI0028A03AE3|nr:uncharacterized protein LOC132284985 [Cornus florida]
MNDLVFVMYNIKLKERNLKRQAVIEPIIFEDVSSDDEWITEKEDPVLPTKTKWLRVLDDKVQEDDSDEEDEVERMTRTLEEIYAIDDNEDLQPLNPIDEANEEDGAGFNDDFMDM